MKCYLKYKLVIDEIYTYAPIVIVTSPFLYRRWLTIFIPSHSSNQTHNGIIYGCVHRVMQRPGVILLFGKKHNGIILFHSIPPIQIWNCSVLCTKHLDGTVSFHLVPFSRGWNHSNPLYLVPSAKHILKNLRFT